MADPEELLDDDDTSDDDELKIAPEHKTKSD